MKFKVLDQQGFNVVVEYDFEDGSPLRTEKISLRPIAQDMVDGAGRVSLVTRDPMVDVVGFLTQYGVALYAGLQQTARASEVPDLSAFVGQTFNSSPGGPT